MAESGHLSLRQVSWLTGLGGLPGPSHQKSDSGRRPQKSRLQWRNRGGFSPPSLFSLGGHLKRTVFRYSVGAEYFRHRRGLSSSRQGRTAERPARIGDVANGGHGVPSATCQRRFKSGTSRTTCIARPRNALPAPGSVSPTTCCGSWSSPCRFRRLRRCWRASPGGSAWNFPSLRLSWCGRNATGVDCRWRVGGDRTSSRQRTG